jgi:hypothetical protein
MGHDGRERSLPHLQDSRTARPLVAGGTAESRARGTEFTAPIRGFHAGVIGGTYIPVMENKKRRISVQLFIFALLLPVGAAAWVAISLVGVQQNGSILLPNAQTIVPAGSQVEVNDRPLGIAVSPDGTQAAVATASNFAPRALHIVDLATQTVAQTIPIGNSFVGVA